MRFSEWSWGGVRRLERGELNHEEFTHKPHRQREGGQATFEEARRYTGEVEGG